jgi:hypothetical protein
MQNQKDTMTVINANSDKVPRNPRASQGVRRKTPGVPDIIGKTRMIHPFIVPQQDPKHQPSVQEENREKPKGNQGFRPRGAWRGGFQTHISTHVLFGYQSWNGYHLTRCHNHKKTNIFSKILKFFQKFFYQSL